MLVFCWPLPLLVKIDGTTLEGNIPNHSQDITKSSGRVQEVPHPYPNTTAPLTLIWVGGIILLILCWFFFIPSITQKQ